MDKETPMWEQYRRFKSQHPDCLLLFRLGDFYELFGADAEAAAPVLGVLLTSREAGKGNRIPMCGVPHHAIEGYLAKLLEAGHRVALCDQVEDPRASRGLVRREVVRVISPGTALLKSAPADTPNYLVTLVPGTAGWGVAAVDCSTGELRLTELRGLPELRKGLLLDELARLRPAELLLPEGTQPPLPLVTVTYRPADLFQQSAAEQALAAHFRGEAGLEGQGCAGMPLGRAAAGACLAYLAETQRIALAHITRLSPYEPERCLVLDSVTCRNLELTRALRDGGRQGTLLQAVDRTATAMGARTLRDWLERPLADPEAIAGRLEAVGSLVTEATLRGTVRLRLKSVSDLERLLGRLAFNSAAPRDLLALASTLEAVAGLKDALSGSGAGLLGDLTGTLDALPELSGLIRRAILPEPAATLNEGRIIAAGFSAEVDRLRALARSGRDFIASLEAEEREATGIKSLKIGYNRVFGYYLEVTRPNLPLVPPHWHRKQTLANGERFVTAALKEKEAEVTGADERLASLEYDLFQEVRTAAVSHAASLRRTAAALGILDVLAGFAETAVARGYRRPRVVPGPALRIVGGRHPVVEASLEAGRYVPNDLHFSDERRFMLLTGPNMAGKSTYMRQVALSVILAQAGSFVPAAEAEIGAVDRIFTRIGASDDLAMGRSTFMVEMCEVASILSQATARSLVLLDEVGRGTGTSDGLALAWAVTERLLDPDFGLPRTIFATHFHELTALVDAFPRAANCSMAVKEEGDAIVFLHQVVPGHCDRSYGLHVARLAGLPEATVDRAQAVLDGLQAKAGQRQSTLEVAAARQSQSATRQASLLDRGPDPVLAELGALRLMEMTPLEALNRLHELQAAARRRL